MKQILIVDDEPQILSLLKAIFTREGFTVIEASNGNAAMELLRTNTIHLIITDIIMPEKEGLEIINELRKDKSDIPIIAMSGGGKNSASRYLETAKLLGAVEVVEKPIEKNILLDLVNKCLS